jgi:ABC-type sugar transport system substrate-binding protein
VFGVDASAVEELAAGTLTGSVGPDCVGVAAALVYMAGNVQSGKPMLEGMTYNVDGGATKARVPYIPYQSP